MSARDPWLFGRSLDLGVFGGSFLASLVLVAVGVFTGVIDQEMPLWSWLAFVVIVDVAHVWSTAWRTYFDVDELRRRPGLYLGIPIAAWLVGVLLHAQSSALFWRVLAYVAVFHFIRQQVGWVALYRRKSGEGSALDRRLDEAMIYASTLYPVLWWHAHLPRRFAWFLQGDFVVGLPAWMATLALAAWTAIAVGWVFRQAFLLVTRRGVSYGKWLVVAATWTCWWLGIVVFDSDYVFTVTNVLIHGVPYFALVWWHARKSQQGKSGWLGSVFTGGALVFVAVPVLLAFGEEALWDRFVWNEHPELFGVWGKEVEATMATLLVPLLALPQATHYALDGFIWRTRDDEVLRRMVE